MHHSQTEEKLKKALESTKRTMEIEGFIFSEEEEKLIESVLRREISHSEFVKKVREIAGK